MANVHTTAGLRNLPSQGAGCQAEPAMTADEGTWDPAERGQGSLQGALGLVLAA